MELDLLGNRGTPLDGQRFTWHDLVQKPCSKLDDWLNPADQTAREVLGEAT